MNGRHQQGLPGDIRLFRLTETKANPTIIRIMQLKRSYSRHLKNVKYEIYELSLSARRAYTPIRLAVKTGRPQNMYELFL